MVGFRVPISPNFISRSYCLAFANDIIYITRGIYGGRTFNSMTATDIASECFAHAMLYYFSTTTIALFNRGYGMNLSGSIIDIDKGDPRKAQFYAIWIGSYLFLPFGIKVN